jgi:hypothetical protein
MGTFLYRVMGAAVLDAGMYESIEADPRATRQAMAVVLVASVAAGLGFVGLEGHNYLLIAAVTGAALIAWMGWASLIQQLGGMALPERDTRVTLGELLRTIGFAAAPGWLLAFAMFPSIRTVVFVIVGLWMLAAMIVAVKHALDYQSTLRAVLVATGSFAIVFAFIWLFSAIQGSSA